jgi:hypothetical protein
MQRLPLLLAMRPDFDTLYSQTLSTSQDLPHFHSIISIIALAQEPLSIMQIAELLGIDTFYISTVLVNLHSIMQVPGDDHSPVTLWHTSLRDFLCSKDRSGLFCVSSIYHLCLSLLPPSLASDRTWWEAYSMRFAQEHLLKVEESINVATGVPNREGLPAYVAKRLNEPIFSG